MTKKKKVGGVIIMHPGQNNYGTSLQGFATVRIVQLLGYDLRIIRYVKKRTFKELMITLPGLIRSGALKQIKFAYYQKRIIKNNPEYRNLIAVRTQSVDKFKANHFDNISDYYIGYKNLSEGSRNYDIVFVGSDQVWGPLSLYARFYNLLFVDKSIPQFSYSSSFGRSSVLPWQQKRVKEFLDRMDAIGVREIKGKEIVDSLSIKKAKVVLDPTMLLTKEQWEEAISDSKEEYSEPYILCYMLGPRKDNREIVTNLGKDLNLKVLVFSHMDWYEPADVGFGDIVNNTANPLDFVKLIKDAKYICTDSFHCTVFSILLHKRFLTFYRLKPTDNKSSHSRIDSLLSITGLENRLFQYYSIPQLISDIDYSVVDKRLEEMREESLKFLKECLEITK